MKNISEIFGYSYYLSIVAANRNLSVFIELKITVALFQIGGPGDDMDLSGSSISQFFLALGFSNKAHITEHQAQSRKEKIFDLYHNLFF